MANRRPLVCFRLTKNNVTFRCLEQRPNLPVSKKARHSTKGGLKLFLIPRRSAYSRRTRVKRFLAVRVQQSCGSVDSLETQGARSILYPKGPINHLQRCQLFPENGRTSATQRALFFLLSQEASGRNLVLCKSRSSPKTTYFIYIDASIQVFPTSHTHLA